MAKAKKKAAKPKAKKLTKTTKQVFMAELAIGPHLFHGGGETATEALDNLCQEVPSTLIRTKAVLSITKDGRSHSEQMYPFTMRRFFANPLKRQLWAKVFANGL